jgi:hypothetical protein
MGQNLDPEKEASPSYEEPEAVAEAREALDDAREALLGEREHQADLRDAEMEERQRRADERDRRADARDHQATQGAVHHEVGRAEPHEQRVTDLISAPSRDAATAGWTSRTGTGRASTVCGRPRTGTQRQVIAPSFLTL